MEKFNKMPELKEKYLKVKYILEEQIKTDTEAEPYKSRYEAREILQEMSSMLNDELQKYPTNNLKDLLAIVFTKISSISYDVDELASGNEFANKSLALAPSHVHASRITSALTCLNNLGFWACHREDYTEAQELLEKAESLYYQYNNEIGQPPTDFDELFTCEPNKEMENDYNKCHTQTLFYLAQVYSKKNNPTKSAKYCHVTLRRQLEAGDQDQVEWALNAATLSQFLIEQNAFKEALHHLAASLIVLQKQNLELDNLLLDDADNDNLKAKKETLRHRLADVYRCCGKYGIFLLNASKERLLSSEGDKVDAPPEAPAILKGITFSSLLEETKEFEESVTSNFILIYEDAKPLFQRSQDWLNSAKEYYTLEDHASEHAAIVLDSSKLYQLLAFYQSDEAIQCKLHKRRIDKLSAIVNSLNPKYYKKICQQYWFELGEISVTMADIKASQSKGDESTQKTQHYAAKVKNLRLQGIKYLKEFVQSFKLKSKEDKYPEEFENSIILGYMYLGHLYGRLNEPDKAALVDYQEKSLKCYSVILDYCSAHPDMKQLYNEEYSVCKEMSELIPLKIKKLSLNLS